MEFADKSELEEYEEYLQGMLVLMTNLENRLLYDPIFLRGFKTTTMPNKLDRLSLILNRMISSGPNEKPKFQIQQR